MARRYSLRPVVETLDRRALLSDGLAPAGPADVILNASQYAQQIAGYVGQAAGYLADAIRTVADPAGAGYRAGMAAVQTEPAGETVMLHSDPPPIQPDGTVRINPDPPTVLVQPPYYPVYSNVQSPVLGADQVIEMPRVITPDLPQPPSARTSDPMGILEPQDQPTGDVYRNNGMIDYDPNLDFPIPIT